ncbi:7859_t:CDS:1 [Diversispora eburnea]|uniref:7859_t:CDS:1 n=1 Tax=Diversispora eburnea TaxID=1213867 RepID=A0A9N8WCH2_9GLOM|nr:7859_t:CDS:1 [Diversispora eburnea]
MSFPPARGHPLNPNTLIDYRCLTAPLNGGGDCPPKPFPCGGYPADSAFGATFNAGQIFDVRFQNPGAQNPTAESDQGRHNGGLCEFSLSYDGGSTWTKIATYHKTCPDVFYGWTVKIPENAPTCDTLGQCIFSWTWINAVGNREFYQNCADVRIIGQSTTPLQKIDFTKANLPEFGNTLTPEGDPANTGNARGSGPLPEDVTANLQPFAPGSPPPPVSNTQPQATDTQPPPPPPASNTQPQATDTQLPPPPVTNTQPQVTDTQPPPPPPPATNTQPQVTDTQPPPPPPPATNTQPQVTDTQPPPPPATNTQPSRTKHLTITLPTDLDIKIKCVRKNRSPYYTISINGNKITLKCKDHSVCRQKKDYIVCK